MAGRSCAALELRDGELAVECYVRSVMASLGRSASATCGLLRVRRASLHRLVSAPTEQIEAEAALWHSRISTLEQLLPPPTRTSAGRCLAAAIALGAPSAEPAQTPAPSKGGRGHARPRERAGPSAPSLTDEGRQLASQGRLVEAEQMLLAAVNVDGSHGEAYLWLGMCMARYAAGSRNNHEKYCPLR